MAKPNFDRLAEPSTYAGLSVLLTTFGLNIGEGMWQSVTFILAGIGGILSMVLGEKDEKKDES